MSHKKQGHLTTSGEWKKHLRPYGKRAYWSKERMAEKLKETIGRSSTTRSDPNYTA